MKKAHSTTNPLLTALKPLASLGWTRQEWWRFDATHQRHPATECCPILMTKYRCADSAKRCTPFQAGANINNDEVLRRKECSFVSGSQWRCVQLHRCTLKRFFLWPPYSKQHLPRTWIKSVCDGNKGFRDRVWILTMTSAEKCKSNGLGVIKAILSNVTF